MRKAALLIVLLLTLAASGLTLEVRGKVVSSEGKLVVGAVVLHRASGAKSQTDEAGRFFLSVPEVERVVLEVIHPDYMEEEAGFTARSLSRPVTITVVPYIKQREEIVVTAMRYPEPSAAVPAAGTVVSAETLEQRMPPNIADAIKDLPGVANLGSGGFSLVPSIRGLSRRRVLLMIDNARLSSDRRTGPGASFISPEDIDRIEVLRSPSSVFYGSDAIGGVVHMLTPRPEPSEKIKGRLHARYGTVNKEKGLGISLSGGKPALAFYLSAQGLDASNYRSPEAEVRQSQYTQSSIFGKIYRQTEKREIEASFLVARGRDIGKPNTTSVSKPTWYPREDQNLLQFRWLEKNVAGSGDLALNLFLNPNFLETRTDTLAAYKTKEAFARTESSDYGAQLSFNKKIAGSFRLSAGTDLYGRAGAEAVNTEKSLDSLGNVTKTFEEHPYTGGARRDFGIFLSGDFGGGRNLDLVGGVRLDFLFSRANPGGGAEIQKNNDTALTGFLAGSYKISEWLVVFANFSRAFRAPDLNERFYTGITGRGFIIAKPDLRPEASLNIDAGFKFLGRRFFAGLYGFSYEINDLIERYKVAETIYTYDNVDKGRIQGIELEWEVFPWPGLSIFGNVMFIDGRSRKTDAPLNDIPPRRFFLGSRAWVGRFSLEVSGAWQQKKGDPGPAEIAISAAGYANLKASYFLARSVSFFLSLNNLFDESYLARPDPEAMPEPGRNLLFGISYSF